MFIKYQSRISYWNGICILKLIEAAKCFIKTLDFFNLQTNSVFGFHCRLLSVLCNKQVQSEKKPSSLKEQLAYVTPLVEDLKLRKEERFKQFADINAQIEKITGEILGYSHIINSVNSMNLDDQDLSLRKLTEYQSHLRNLQKEKVCTLPNFVVTVLCN